MANANPELSFRTGEIRIDLRARTLLIGGRAAKLGGRAFDVLHALLERHDRVVTKQELLDVVWPGLVVEENTLQVHVVALRKLLGAEAIATVSGRGYRFTLTPDREESLSSLSDPPPPLAKAPTTRLIGRDDLVLSVCDLLSRPEVRLVSLTGPGGSGKTRLGLHVTAQTAAAFRDGAYTVMLAPVREAPRVASTIATALHVQEAGSQPIDDLLLAHLREREMLLALDNFEHVIAASPLVATLLASCPGLKILTTSRAPLKLAGEHEVPVPPLALPARYASAAEVPRSPAVKLLRERAAAAGRPVGETAGELAIVAEICRTLDGLPLALELAAARLKILSPQVLLKRLGVRMQLLGSDADDLPPRQRTLRATIDWSHDLLTVPERRLFRRLAVFTGGWSLEAAEAVTDSGDLSGSVLDLLTTVVEQNLAQRTEDVDGEPRFTMLETVREYAHEQLAAGGDMGAVRQRHAEYFLDLAETAEPALTSPQRGRRLERLQADYQNLRAALSWLTQERRDADGALRLAAALPWFWYFAGLHSEGRAWLRLALAVQPSDSHVVARARALSGASRLATFTGDMAEAAALAEQSVALWRGIGDRRGLGFALFHLGVPAMFSRGREAALAVMQESLECFRDIADAWGVALATTYKGVLLAFTPGKEQEAQPLLVEGQARFMALRDDWGASTAPGYLAAILMRSGKFDQARQVAEDLMKQITALGDTFRMARGFHQLAEISLAQGRLPEASAHLEKSLAMNREQNRLGDALQQLRLLARLELLQQRPQRSARLLAMSLRPDAPKSTLPPDDAQANRQACDAAREALGAERFESEWTLGTIASVSEALAWALESSPARD